VYKGQGRIQCELMTRVYNPPLDIEPPPSDRGGVPPLRWMSPSLRCFRRGGRHVQSGRPVPAHPAFQPGESRVRRRPFQTQGTA